MSTRGGSRETQEGGDGTELVERGAQLSRLIALLDSSTRKHSPIVAVRGPVATGKSALIREFVCHCAAAGATVLTANGSLAEQSRPHALVRQLFDDCNDLLDPEQVGDEPPTITRVGEILHKALLARLGPRPLVVCVDDLHFADEASLQSLLYVQRRLVASPILFLFTVADHLRAKLTEFEAELARRARVHSVDVGPLSRAGVHAVARRHTVPDWSAGRSDTVYAACGGNPLLLKGLLTDVVATGGGVGTDAGSGFRDAVAACLYRGGAGMRDVAQALALVPDVPEVVARLVRVGPDDVDRLVRALVAAGMTDSDGAYRTEAVRDAVLETMEPAVVADLHGRLAELFHERGEACDAVARHLMAAAAPLAPWAVEVLVEAAEEAVVGGEFERAERYMERASDAEVDERTRAYNLGLLVRIKWQTNPRSTSTYLAALQDALVAGHLGDQDAGRLASYLLWHGRITEAVDVVEWMESLRAGRTPALNDALNATRSWMQYLHPRRDAAHDARAADRDKASKPDATGDIRLHGTTALVSVLAGGADADCSSAEFVLQSTEMGNHSDESVFAALLALVYADRLGRADYWCELLLGHAHRNNMTTLSAIVLAVSADIALRQGKLAVARDRASEAVELISGRGWGVVIAYPQGTLVAATSGLSRYAEAAEHLRRPLPAGVFDTAFGLNYLCARGMYALRTERYFAALEDFQRSGRLMREWGLDRAIIAPWRLGLGMVHAALGRADEAKTLFDEQSRRRRREPGVVRGVSLQLLARLSPPEVRNDLLRESVALLRESGHAFDLAISLVELSNERYARGDTKQAQDSAREAIEIATACGVTEDVRRILREGHRFDLAGLLGEQDAPVGHELSNAEGRVAALAAEGMANRQIGARLHLSTSTVEQHLTRVYRKLQVTRRSDLAGVLWPPRTETA